MIYNENLVNGVEVIDDPNHDQLQLFLELCDKDICEFNETQMKFDNSIVIIKGKSTNDNDKELKIENNGLNTNTSDKITSDENISRN